MVNLLIFGIKNKSKPFPNINHISSGWTSLFFSRTNFNLFLFGNESKYVSLGTLLEKSNEPVNLLSSSFGSSTTNDLIFEPEVCFRCAEESLGCPLVVRSTNGGSITIGKEKLTVKWWNLKDETEMHDWDTECPYFKSLLGLTQTEAERRFLKLYLDTYLRFYLEDLFSKLIAGGKCFMEGQKEIIADVLKSTPLSRVPKGKGWGRNKGGVPHTVAALRFEEYDKTGPSDDNVHLAAYAKYFVEKMNRLHAKRLRTFIGTVDNLESIELYELGKWLRRSLSSVPALIPQVWIRHIYDPARRRAGADPLKEEAPSRVDFVVLWSGKKVVIEIDGPEHYANWDEMKKQYEVSEDKYTHNLKTERKLKEEGWLFIRISNQEVNNAKTWNDIEKLIKLDYLIASPGEPSDDYPDCFYFH